jgi:MoaA/NifB/PqqE/SkfB family radical SAM enzyme
MIGFHSINDFQNRLAQPGICKNIAYGIGYILGRRIFHRDAPLICGLTLTDRCNLRCLHCRVANRRKPDLTFAEAVGAMDAFYDEGGRTLYLQGGEPFLWRDEPYTLEDIVRYSRKKGFFTTILYTNGTIPLHTSANTVFISIDGLQATHDSLRGPTFDRILLNIRKSTHPSLYVNYTINSLSKNDIEPFCSFIKSIDQIRGVFFYFHTPYYGQDDLYLAERERQEILVQLLKYKKQYKILNSRAGLMSAMKNNWRRPLDICRVYENGTVYECCRFPGDTELCRNCGYLSYAEIDQTLKLKPSAIANALRYF